jgi:hypothetical protein
VCFRHGPQGEPPPDIAARLAATEWALAVANGNAWDIQRRLAPDAELTAQDGRVITGGEAVAAYLKSAFTGTRFVAGAIEARTPRVIVRAQVLGSGRGAAPAAAATLELAASADRQWRIVRIRMSGPA